MMVRIAPSRNRSRHTLTVTRDDGSVTCSHLNMPPEHDLVHYAVETTLELPDSFFGLLSRGWDIETFHRPGITKSGLLPIEAVQTEFIVGLLQIERRNGVPYQDFNAELARACAGNGVAPPPAIPDDDLATIRSRIDDLLTQFQHSDSGITLEFKSPSRPS